MNFEKKYNFSTTYSAYLSRLAFVLVVCCSFYAQSAFAQVCPVSITGDLAFCPGESATLNASAGFASYQWSNNDSGQGISVTSGGTYCVTATDGMGCANSSCVVVEALSSPITTIIDAICEGEAYLFEGNFYDQSGTYQEVLTAANGCDSTIVLNLTVEEAILFPLTTAICEGESLIVGDSTYTEPGFYFNLFISSSGCDSLVFTELSVGTDVSTSLTETICAGQSVTIGSSTFTESGTYTEVLSSFAGCDSTINLTLNVLPEIEVFLTETVCGDGSIQIDDMVFNQTGTYQVMLTAANGCDSTVNLDLLVAQEYEMSIEETICGGESYEIEENSFTEAGTYEVNLTSSQGCDSTINLTLNVLGNSSASIEAFICPGTDVDIGEESFDVTGMYEVVLMAANGCDSIVSLDLVVLESFETSATDVICPGQVYEIGDATFSMPGTYQVTLAALNGCDSLVNLTLEAATPSEADFTDQICEGGTYSLGGEVFDAPGIYEVTLTAANGCDSIVTLTLEESQTLNEDVVATVCDGESFPVGEMMFSEAGNYEVMLQSQFGCDSIVSLTLSVGQSSASFIMEEICEGDAFMIGEEAFTASGTYMATILNQEGCDSMVTLDLTVFETTTMDLNSSICAGESVIIGGQEFSESGSFTVEEVDANGCVNVTNLSLVVFPTSSVVEEVLCPGESITVNGTVYDENNPTGTEVIPNGSMAFNCDSTINVTLTFSPKIEVVDTNIVMDDGSGNGSIDPQIVGGEGTLEYEWSNGANTQSINNLSAGNYTLVVVDENGCVEIFNFMVDMVSSIQEELDNGITTLVYPNPSKERIFVELENAPVDEKQFILYDVFGRIIRRATFVGNKLEVEMPTVSGTYFYQIKAEETLLSVGKVTRS